MEFLLSIHAAWFITAALFGFIVHLVKKNNKLQELLNKHWEPQCLTYATLNKECKDNITNWLSLITDQHYQTVFKVTEYQRNSKGGPLLVKLKACAVVSTERSVNTGIDEEHVFYITQLKFFYSENTAINSLKG